MTDSPKVVLAVDDDPDVLNVVQAILLRFGYQVIAAANAEEALQRFAGMPKSPDLVLTDIIMPGDTGPVLAERLLQQDPTLRVMFMSGSDDRSIAEISSVRESFPFISKPFTSDALGARVREVLSQDGYR